MRDAHERKINPHVLNERTRRRSAVAAIRPTPTQMTTKTRLLSVSLPSWSV